MPAPPPSLPPLAERMRPCCLDDLIGQGHLLAPGQPLRHAFANGHLHSLILWGPPGSGKTTLARLLAAQTEASFIRLSAVLAGVREVRAAVAAAQIQRAQSGRPQSGRGTILFIDEVHRFNKAQQDALLPHVEDGTLVFIGATTENPSFELNNALLSRARVYVLQPLTPAELEQVIDRAMAASGPGLGGQGLAIAPAARVLLAAAADGDARQALNLLELAADLAGTATAETNGCITEAIAAQVAGSGLRRFDKGGDAFYDQISALHKAVRGSAPDAALYWLARLLDGGCDPRYVARRLVRMASEDIGNADPRALTLTLEAWDCQQRLGAPEGELALAQAAVYLACAAKSNAVYLAWNAAREDARRLGSLAVPLHLRNAPTRLLQELGHGRAYRYPHDEPDGYAAGVGYFPDGMRPRRYYRPVTRGLEIRIAEKLQQLRQRDDAAAGDEPPATATAAD